MEYKKCIICGYKYCIGVKYNYCSVSSDNKKINKKIIAYTCKNCGYIFKKIDKKLINKIYDRYETDSILPHQEQAKFINEKIVPISYAILENTKEYFSAKGSLLDIGSGAGGMLKSASELLPNYVLNAYDLNAVNSKKFKTIRNFSHFFTNFDKIKMKFDLITMIHVLEHIINPNDFLKALKKKMSHNAFLLIQVPDVSQNKLDLFTYDHISHFDKFSLHNLLRKHFCKIVFPDKQLPRQITCLASNQTDSSMIDFLSKIESIDRGVYVFGTTTVSTFIGNILGDRLIAYLDEDKQKIGKKHKEGNNGMILDPSNINKNSLVILPFDKNLASKIKEKFQHFKYLDMQ